MNKWTEFAVFEDGKILLVLEKNGTWPLPGGWCDVNQSVASNTVKETREEAELQVIADKIIAVPDWRRHNKCNLPFGVIKILPYKAGRIAFCFIKTGRIALRFLTRYSIRSTMYYKCIHMKIRIKSRVPDNRNVHEEGNMHKVFTKRSGARVLSMFLAALLSFSSVDLTAYAAAAQNGAVVTEAGQADRSDIEGSGDASSGNADKPGDSDAGNGDKDKPGDSDAGNGDKDKPGDSDAGNGDKDEPGNDTDVSGDDASVSDGDAKLDMGDASLEAQNSLGRLFKDIMSETEVDTEQTGCGVYSVVMDGTKATASIQALEDCTLVVGIYEEDGIRLIATGTADVTAGDTDVTVNIEADTLPAYYHVKAFLVDNVSLRPCSKVYETDDYTRKMQEFFAKTTSDFTESQVLNLDADETNNFLVFADSVTVIPKSTDASVNVVAEADEENLIWKIKNPGEDFLALKEGDIFTYYYTDEDIIITRVISLSTEGEAENTVLTIQGTDPEYEDVISFIKYGAANPADDDSGAVATYAAETVVSTTEAAGADNTATYAAGAAVSTTEAAGADNTATYAAGAAENATEAAEAAGIATQADRAGTTYGGVNFPWKMANLEVKPPESNVKIELSDIGGAVSVKIYVDTANDINTIEAGVSYGVTIKAEVKIDEKEWTKDISLGEIKEPLGLTGLVFSAKVQFVLSVEGNVSAEGTLTGSVGFRCNKNTGVENISKTPELTLTKTVEVTFKVGLKMSIGLELIDDKIASLAVEAEGGLKLKIKAKAKVLDSSSNRHLCNTCFTVNIGPYFEADVKVETLKIFTKKWPLIEKNVSWGSAYFSLDYAPHFGWGDCPHVQYQGNVRVLDKAGNPVAGAAVIAATGNNVTNSKGETRLNLNVGKQNIYVKKDGALYSAEVKLPDGVDKITGTVTLTINPNAAKKLSDSAYVEQVYAMVYNRGSYDKNVTYAALTADGSLYMWGGNDYGQVGIGSTDNQDKPVKVLENVKEFGFPDDRNPLCAAVTKDGSLYMWGSDSYGRLANGQLGSKQLTPYKVEFDRKDTKVANVYFPSDNVSKNGVAITTDGELYLWGTNSYNEINSSNSMYVTVPTRLLTNVESFTVYRGTCAAIEKSGALWLWGNNTYGIAGKISTQSVVSPEEAVHILDGVKEVHLNYENGVAVRKNGTLWIWGYGYGQMAGEGDNEQWIPQQQILPEEEITGFYEDKDYGSKYALTAGGELYAWGSNAYGQLGTSTNAGTSSKNNTPAKVSISGIKEFAVQNGTCAALTKEGKLYLWGRNQAGQLGNGSTGGYSYLPTAVLTDKKVTEFQFLFGGKLCAAIVQGTASGISKDLYTWGSYKGGSASGVFSANEADLEPTLQAENIKSFLVYPDVEYTYLSTISDLFTQFAVVKKDGTLWEWLGTKEGKQREDFTETAGTAVCATYVVNGSVYRQNIAIDNKGGLYTYGNPYFGEKTGVTEQYLFGDKVVTKELKSSTASQAAIAVQSMEGMTDAVNAAESPENVTDVADAAGSMENANDAADDSDSGEAAPAGDFSNWEKNFDGLLPNEIYNIYAVKSKEAENVLGSDNLLYIGQETSTAEGTLQAKLALKESCEAPEIFCVAYSRTDLSEAEVQVEGIIYDGMPHIPQVTVICEGKTLVPDKDYVVYYEEQVTEVGNYELTVKGIGVYEGEKAVSYFVADRGDILMEDTPEDGIIPEGLWVAGIREGGYDYTGTAIKPEMRVYDKNVLLKEQVDYTVSYKNNINANDASVAAKAPTLTVTGKGNYTGKDTKTFKILPLDISSPLFEAENISIASTGKAQKPVPTLYFGSRQLKNKTEFTYSYYKTDETTAAAGTNSAAPALNAAGTDNAAPADGAEKLASVKDTGTYYVELTGNGNFTGSRTVKLTVLLSAKDNPAVKLISKVTVARIPSQVYVTANKNGVVTPEITVKDGKNVLEEGVHYTVSYSNNNRVGTAFAIIEGIEEAGYSGSRRVAFQITGTAISKAKVTGLTGQTFVYNGEFHTPELTLTMKLNGEEKPLTENKDYTVQWQKNQNAGTATVVFTGINGYTGTMKKTFRIQAFNMAANADGRLEAKLVSTEVPYAKGGAKPELSVTFKTESGDVLQLKEGVDYTVTYKNNKALNDGSNEKKLPSVTIKGKGNFTGTYKEVLPFTIVAQDISKLTLTAADKVYRNKGNVYATKVTVTDLDGKVLNAGTDYEKTLLYTYKEDTTLDDGTVRTAGTVIDKKDIIPAGTVICVTVTPKGNYTGEPLTGEYAIKTYDISGAAVTIPAQIYTGKPITLDKTDPKQITVKVKGKVVDPDQFEIVSYRNNVAKGTATVIIRGKDNYGGTKKVTFKINAKKFLWWSF